VVVDGEPRDYVTVWMEGESVKLIDQRRLPERFEIFEAPSVERVAYAIREMVVRGAPAIGATAAYGMAQGRLQGGDLREVARTLESTRPTANDLFDAVQRMADVWEDGGDVRKAAEAYAQESVRRCRGIGENGAPLIDEGSSVLTHCNAGALAAVDVGTALAPIRVARDQKKKPFVLVDETRPRLQGAHLTAWELLNEGIDHAVIADNAAGYFMSRGEVDLVIVGADRVVANGDVANKIGTYTKALAARENGVPFYVAAPSSTFDFGTPDGTGIVIEERDSDEVLHAAGRRTAPRGSGARNPAFDVTPARYVTGYITEVGVLRSGELSRLQEAP
jgi:translation initiation factor eIF-2B subunit alpha/methylthioribose-1-phosphate isomerase